MASAAFRRCASSGYQPGTSQALLMRMRMNIHETFTLHSKNKRVPCMFIPDATECLCSAL